MMRTAMILLWLWTGVQAVGADYETARARACKEGKMLYVLITTPQCSWCRRFETTTLTDRALHERLEKSAVIVEVTRGEGGYPESLASPVVPMHYFLSPEGRVLVKMPGYWNVEDFTSILNDAQRRFDNAVCTDR